VAPFAGLEPPQARPAPFRSAAGQSTGAHRPAINKQSYIRFATSLLGRSPVASVGCRWLQFAVNIWQRFQMPAHGRKGPQQILPRRPTGGAPSCAGRYNMDTARIRQRAGPTAKPARSTPPNRSRQTQTGILPLPEGADRAEARRENI
jgi:hypothetical protein